MTDLGQQIFNQANAINRTLSDSYKDPAFKSDTTLDVESRCKTERRRRVNELTQELLADKDFVAELFAASADELAEKFINGSTFELSKEINRIANETAERQVKDVTPDELVGE